MLSKARATHLTLGNKINMFGVEITLSPSHINGAVKVELDKKHHDINVSQVKHGLVFSKKGLNYEQQ